MTARLGSRRPFAWLVSASAMVIALLFAGLASQVGRPYPGFFVALDHGVFPVEPAARAAGLAYGDRIVSADGQSPLGLAARVAAAPDAPAHAIAYQVDRGGRAFRVDLAPARFTWAHLADHFAVYFAVSALMLATGVAVLWQNPAARPNRFFVVYMCLRAVSNVAVPEAILGTYKYGAAVVGFVPTLLRCTDGCSSSRTRPTRPARNGRRASGLTTNIAARLAALARGGELMVSEETWARLDGEGDAEDLGVQPLKNVERPVRVFRLLHSGAP